MTDILELARIRAVPIPTAFRGYSRQAVDRLLDELTGAIQKLADQSASLSRELEQARAERELVIETLDAVSADHKRIVESLETITRERGQLLAHLERLEQEVAGLRAQP